MEILFLILSVIGTILKFIFFALFYILLAIIIIMLIVLITPFHIKIKAKVTSDNLEINSENISANIYLTYLFKLLKVNVDFDKGKLATKIKIFLFELGKEKKQKDKKENCNDYEKDEHDNKVVTVDDNKESIQLDKVVENIDDVKSIDNNIKVETNEKKSKEPKEAEESKKIEDENLSSDDNKKGKTTREKINSVLEKIIYIKNYKNKKLILNLIAKHILNIIKSFKPVYINITGRFGLDDPADTGKLIGILSILNSFSYLYIDLKPDFNNARIDTEIDLYIKFRLWTIVYNFTALAWKVLRIHLKNEGLTLMKLIKKLFKKKGDKNGR